MARYGTMNLDTASAKDHASKVYDSTSASFWIGVITAVAFFVAWLCAIFFRQGYLGAVASTDPDVRRQQLILIVFLTIIFVLLVITCVWIYMAAKKARSLKMKLNAKAE